MEISPLRLFWLTVGCFLLGAATGVLHDVHRLIRILLGASYQKSAEDGAWQLRITGKPWQCFAKKMLVFIQDVLLFLFAGIGLILLNFRLNDGQLRFMSLMALCLGFLVYYVTFGRILLRINQWISNLIKKILIRIFSIVSKPILLFVEFFRNIAKIIFKKITKAIAKKRKKVYNISSRRLIVNRTIQGFLTDKTD